MATTEKPTARSVKGVYDGKHVVLSEPLDVPAGTVLDVAVPVDRRTWAEKHLGLPHIELRGPGLTFAEMVSEDRGTAEAEGLSCLDPTDDIQPALADRPSR